MNRVQKMGILILVMAVLTGVLVAGASMAAASPATVEILEYNADAGFLKISLGEAVEVSTLNPPAGSEADWDTIKANTRTLWVVGKSMTKYTGSTFDGFSGVIGLILDAPELTSASSSDFTKITHLYYTTSSSEVIENAFESRATLRVIRQVASEALNTLCKVTVDKCEDGMIITDAPAYVMPGTEVNVAALPDPNYKVSFLYGGETEGESDSVRTIRENTVFTAGFYYAGLMEYDHISETGSFGDCSDKNSTVRWYLYENGELMIVGLGSFKYPSSSEPKWRPWADVIQSVTIGEGISGIPDSSNSEFKLPQVKTVTIAASVDSIGDNAFYNCPQLREAVFMGKRPTMGTRVFPGAADPSADLVGLFSVIYENEDLFGSYEMSDQTRTYPTRYQYKTYKEFEELTSIGGDLYVNSQGIVFKLTGGEATVGDGDGRNNSRYDGNNNGKVYIPEKVTYMGQSYNVTAIAANAFSHPYATSAEALKTPYQFYGNVFLKELTLGANISYIADGVFYGCPSFEAFTVRDGSRSFRELDGVLYSFDKSILFTVPAAKHFAGTYEVPASVTRIENGAFYGCTGIGKVEIRSGVSEVGNRAFFNASGIQEIRMLSDVRLIGERAFNGCTALTSLEIYDGLSGMGAVPFEGCPNLRTLILPFLGTSPTNGAKLKDLFGTGMRAQNVPVQTLCVARGTLEKSALKDCIQLQSAYFSERFKSIPDSCFEGCGNLSRLDFGTPQYNIRRFGADEHAGTAHIRENVSGIGKLALKDCFSVARYEVDESNPAFVSDHFGVLYSADYSKLICYPPASDETIYCVKRAAESIGSYAFCSCNNLRTLNIPNPKTLPQDNSVTQSGFKIWMHANSAAETKYDPLNCMIFERHNPTEVGIYKLPDRLAFEAGSEPEFTNLYLYAKYSGSSLVMLDELDYTLSVSGTGAGAQTVTVTMNQKGTGGEDITKQFNIYLFKKQNGYTIAEYTNIPSDAVLWKEKLNGFSALYNHDGKMLYVCNSVMIDNVDVTENNELRCAAYVPNEYLDGSATTLKLFTLNGIAPGKDNRDQDIEALQEIWLPAPTELKWGIAYNRTTGASVSRKGEISWRTDENDENFYYLRVYKVGAGANGADKLIGSSTILSNARMGQYLDSKEYLPRIKESGSGKYYFTVQSICYCDVYRIGCTIINSVNSPDSIYRIRLDGDTCSCGLHHRSKVMRSDVFDYKQPTVTLDPCTKPQWSENHQELRWTLPSDTSQYGGYTITFYYGREYSDYTARSGRLVGSTSLYFDVGESYLNDSFKEQIQRFYARNEYRAGYYWFTVTAEPKDMTVANRSAESEWSTAAYYEGVPGYSSPYYVFVKANTEANNADKPLYINRKAHYAYDLYLNGWLASDVYLNDALPKNNPAGIYTYSVDYNNIYTLTPVTEDTYQKVVTVDLKSGDIKNGVLTLKDESVKVAGAKLTNMVVNTSGKGAIDDVSSLESALGSKTVTVTYLARKDRDGNWLPTGPIYVTDLK